MSQLFTPYFFHGRIATIHTRALAYFFIWVEFLSARFYMPFKIFNIELNRKILSQNFKPWIWNNDVFFEWLMYHSAAVSHHIFSPTFWFFSFKVVMKKKWIRYPILKVMKLNQKEILWKTIKMFWDFERLFLLVQLEVWICLSQAIKSISYRAGIFRPWNDFPQLLDTLIFSLYNILIDTYLSQHFRIWS